MKCNILFWCLLGFFAIVVGAAKWRIRLGRFLRLDRNLFAVEFQRSSNEVQSKQEKPIREATTTPETPTSTEIVKKKDPSFVSSPLMAIFALHSFNLSGDYLPESITPAPNDSTQHSENEAYFDPTIPKNVTAYNGKSAYLACRVINMGNRTLSWIRHADIHILSVGTYIYTSDQRYVTLHEAKTGEWTLQIKWVNSRDEGMYGCQLNTQPVKSYFIRLKIVGIPAAFIPGGIEMYVDQGSTLNITCILNASDSQLFWYHDGEIINYDSERGGITVNIEKGNTTLSTLRIKNASYEDSGNYTCSPSNANSASTHVHVIKGDQPAAMHKGAAGETSATIGLGILFIFHFNSQISSLPCIPILVYIYYVIVR